MIAVVATDLRHVLIDAVAVGRSYSPGGVAVAALVSATFQIRAGSRVALVGRSGSGKSTLLHLMAGLDRPTSGHLSWPGLGPAESLLPAKIGLVFQAPSLLEPLTVAENVSLPLLMSGSAAQTQTDIERRVTDALATFDLEDLADKLPQTLSGGQMQRVAMARAIVGEPMIILADEPTGQLDRATGRTLLDALLEHLAGTATALVIATHDSEVAERMSTVWDMQRGMLTMRSSLGTAA